MPRSSIRNTTVPIQSAADATQKTSAIGGSGGGSSGSSNGMDIINLTDYLDEDGMDADLQAAIKLSQTIDKPDLTEKSNIEEEAVSPPLSLAVAASQTPYYSIVFSELVGFGMSQSVLSSEQQVRAAFVPSTLLTLYTGKHTHTHKHKHQ